MGCRGCGGSSLGQLKSQALFVFYSDPRPNLSQIVCGFEIRDERYSGGVDAVERFEYGGIGPGPGLDDIEEAACVDERVGFLLDDLIYHF